MKPTPPGNRLIHDDDDEPVRSVAATRYAPSPAPSVAQPVLDISPQSAPRPATAHSAPPPRAPEPARRPAHAGPLGKGPYPGRKQVTAHIDRQLFLWLKSIAAQTDKPMVAIFEEALSAYVSSYAAHKKFGG